MAPRGSPLQRRETSGIGEEIAEHARTDQATECAGLDATGGNIDRIGARFDKIVLMQFNVFQRGIGLQMDIMSANRSSDFRVKRVIVAAVIRVGSAIEVGKCDLAVRAVAVIAVCRDAGQIQAIDAVMGVEGNLSTVDRTDVATAAEVGVRTRIAGGNAKSGVIADLFFQAEFCAARRISQTAGVAVACQRGPDAVALNPGSPAGNGLRTRGSATDEYDVVAASSVGGCIVESSHHALGLQPLRNAAQELLMILDADGRKAAEQLAAHGVKGRTGFWVVEGVKFLQDGNEVTRGAFFLVVEIPSDAVLVGRNGHAIIFPSQFEQQIDIGYSVDQRHINERQIVGHCCKLARYAFLGREKSVSRTNSVFSTLGDNIDGSALDLRRFLDVDQVTISSGVDFDLHCAVGVMGVVG